MATKTKVTEKTTKKEEQLIPETKVYINEELNEKTNQQNIEEELKSRAEKRNTIFKKFQKMFTSYMETAEFKQPILILLRRGGEAEFFENATKGTFPFQHTDGTEREIILTSKGLYDFPYGKKTFKGYICHEDYPLPVPEDPIITVEAVQTIIDKALNDIKKWQAQETKAFGDMIFKILAGIALIIGAYIIYRMVIPAPPIQIIGQAISNATGITNTSINSTIGQIPL